MRTEVVRDLTDEEGDTPTGILAEYEGVAARTDEPVATLPDPDADHALPEAPWF